MPGLPTGARRFFFFVGSGVMSSPPTAPAIVIGATIAVGGTFAFSKLKSADAVKDGTNNAHWLRVVPFVCLAAIVALKVIGS